MYVYVCICIHKHIHTCLHACTNTCILVYTYMHIDVCAHIYIYIYIDAYTYISIYIYIIHLRRFPLLLIHVYMCGFSFLKPRIQQLLRQELGLACQGINVAHLRESGAGRHIIVLIIIKTKK